MTAPLKQKTTNSYYETNAEQYFSSTRKIDMREIYSRFLKFVPEGGEILDAGSGSGRDTLAFLESGYKVDAFDASQALCELSTKLTGVKTRLLTFQNFSSSKKYDGIWACASLLHVPKNELSQVVFELIESLKAGGVFYFSFKHGNQERLSKDGRTFSDMDEDSIRKLFEPYSNIKIIDLWLSSGELNYSEKVEWINVIVEKQESY
tara:strand:- start:2370 stop:2987 length:618 start_codon:yes stop_codon:yes gene_type:complete